MTVANRDYYSTFRHDGYFVQNSVFVQAQIRALRAAIDAIPAGEEVRRRKSVYGVRNLLEVCPAVCELAASPAVRQFVTPLLGGAAFAVRAIYFNKPPGGNWSLFWHQDNAISVREHVECAGFMGWSRKAGVWQVQPPPDVLANMIAVRVHLDANDANNGPLRVLPGSHCHGWLDDKIDEWKRRVPEVICTVDCGGVVVMCPLTLHASARSESDAQRRVIHIEFAADDLPGGLQWNNRVG